jgi:hypothetical protein
MWRRLLQWRRRWLAFPESAFDSVLIFFHRKLFPFALCAMAISAYGQRIARWAADSPHRLVSRNRDRA